MELDVQYLFDNQLISALEQLIKNAKTRLLLISPYIDLDPKTMSALKEKRELPDLKLCILFGKNQHDYYRSIKKENLEFLKGFPNVEIRYNERLHAKYYENEFENIITSLNLVRYSVANNIEIGVRNQYARKGLIARQLDEVVEAVSIKIDKIKTDYFGGSTEIDVLEKFEQIFQSSELMYKTNPIISQKSIFGTFFGEKTIQGFEVCVDKFVEETRTVNSNTPVYENIKTTVTSTTETVVIEYQYLSATKIAEKFNLGKSDIVSLMLKKGLILSENEITEEGKSKGLSLKNYKGRNYIVYPINLQELDDFRKSKFHD